MRRLKFVCVVSLILIFRIDLHSQNLFPENEPVYVDTEVPRIDITMLDVDLLNLYKAGNELSNVEYRSVFVFSSSGLVDTVFDVGIRFRGNTSRYSQKKSFKVSFNTFVVGQKFQGLEKMNLNGEHNDPSIIRSKLCWDMLNSIGVPAPRANHVRLYINNQYYGLYISVEHIDDQFVKLRFGNSNGNLYKCLYPADLTYRGTNPNSYKFTANGYRVYDLKTNVEADDYSDIAKLIQVINQTSVSELPAKLEPIFNVNTFLKYLAVEALVGNWDGYSYNKNNFYLYRNTSTGRFEFIPYDLDNTFGIDWFGIDWATRNVLSWSSSEERPLTKKILSVDVYKKRYLFFIKELQENWFSPSVLSAKVNSIHYRIRQYANSDSYRSLDYGWSDADFDNSYSQSLGGHVKYGLIPYINKRNQYASSQFSVTNIPPVVSNVYHKVISHKVPITVAAHVDDEDVPKSVKLTYWTNSGKPHEVVMAVDSSTFYSAEIDPSNDSFTTFNYYITATYDRDQNTREPLVGEYCVNLSNNSSLSLCINEVMTSNSHTYPDEYGDYSDWIELYNYGSSSIELGNICITDNLDKPGKWQFPDLTIQPGEFKLFWADGNIAKGSNHLPFKLNRDGEDVGIFTSKELGYRYIDGYRICKTSKDCSYGYYPNSVGLPLELKSPTPGFSNVKTEGSYRLVLPEISLYPNPFSEALNVKLTFAPSSNYTVSVYSLSGVLVAEKQVSSLSNVALVNFDLSGKILTNGVYLVTVAVEEKKSVKLISKSAIYLSKGR